MGESNRPFFEASFNRAIKVQGGDDRLTSDGGAMLLREADHRLGLIDSLANRVLVHTDVTPEVRDSHIGRGFARTLASVRE